jgi:hypothetical protein
MKRKSKKVEQIFRDRRDLVAAILDIVEVIPRDAVLNVDPANCGLNIELPSKCGKADLQRLSGMLLSKWVLRSKSFHWG